MAKDMFKDFYKKTIEERIAILKSLNLFDESLNEKTNNQMFDHLIENFITTYEVGMGIAPNFLVDNKLYQVPMATEEPSVIAGASHAAKIILENGGFETVSINRVMIGQIIFKNVIDQKSLKKYLENNFDKFKEIGFNAHKEIHNLGGGIKSFNIELLEHNFVCLKVNINTLDAMGANTVNTILEAISNYITSHYETEVLMSILSNLALKSLVHTKVKIDPKSLKYSDVVGRDIELASLYASVDPYRAATHNKGVMNGITALMLATGNDTRSIEAGAHAYAAVSGKYLPLTKWYMKDSYLIGEIKIPLALGTVGGSINYLPKVKLAHKILNINNAIELMKIASALGLAQNFAALYALTTDGINKGHMRLHARSVAKEAGASDNKLEEVINYMIKKNSITLKTAKEFLKNTI